MELNNSSSESDERMKRRFGFEFSSEKKEDDDEEDEKSLETKDKRSRTKTPSRSLFFGANRRSSEDEKQAEEMRDPERSPEDAVQRQVLLRTILKHDKASEDDEGSKSDVEYPEDGAEPAESGLNAAEEHETDDEVGADAAQTEAGVEAETEQLEAELQEIVEIKIEKLHADSEDLDESADGDNESTTSTKAAELAADIGFLEKVASKMKEGVEAPVAIEESVVESLSEPDENTEDEGDALEVGTTGENIEVPTESLAEDEESNEPAARGVTPVAAATAAASAASAAASVGGGNAGTRTTPASAATPPPPLSSAGGLPPPPPTIHRNYVMPPPPGVPSPNVAPQPAFNPNILTAPAAAAGNIVVVNDVYRRNRNTGKLILAGVVGYAFGRRRGRIRTENRMQPEIDAGQKRIQSLEQQLGTNEQLVRHNAVNVQRTKDELSEQTLQKQEAETARAKAEQQVYEQKHQIPTAAELLAGAQASGTETIAPQVVTAEAASSQTTANLESQGRSPSELLAYAIPMPNSETNLGKELLRAPFLVVAGAEALRGSDLQENLQRREEAAVLQAENDPALAAVEANVPAVSVESRPAPWPTAELQQKAHEVLRKTASESAPVEAMKSLDVQTMTMPELLNIAEKIDVGSGNLKDMFEHRRIDAVNLRRVITEFAQGKNYQETLHRSLEAEEMHRELRNEVKTDSTGIFDGSGAASQKSTGSASTSGGAPAVQSNQSPGTVASDRSRPLDIPPPSTSFMPETAASPSWDDTSDSSPAAALSSAVIIALGMVAGAVVAGIVLFALGIV